MINTCKACSSIYSTNVYDKCPKCGSSYVSIDSVDYIDNVNSIDERDMTQLFELQKKELLNISKEKVIEFGDNFGKVKISLPDTESNYKEGKGEGIWVALNSHSSRESIKEDSENVIIYTFSIGESLMYPYIKTGTLVVVKTMGKNRPVALWESLENKDKAVENKLSAMKNIYLNKKEQNSVENKTFTGKFEEFLQDFDINTVYDKDVNSVVKVTYQALMSESVINKDILPF